MKKLLGNILFWFCILIAPVAFSLCIIIGEPDIFGTAGIIRYSWILLCFIPVGIITFISGIILKRTGEEYKKNLIVSIILIFLLLFFGLFRLFFSSMIYYENTDLIAIQETIKFNFPENIKVATQKGFSNTINSEDSNEINLENKYTVSYAKITDSDKIQFEKKMKEDHKWSEHLSSTITNALPYEIQFEFETYDYYLFYNKTLNTFNSFPPQSGTFDCILIAYNSQFGRLLLLNSYKMQVSLS